MSKAVVADEREELTPEASDEAAVSILTNGDPIRSFVRLLSPIANEVRLRFDSDGLHVSAVDPASVAMIGVTAHATGFERFEVSEPIEVGASVERLRDMLSFARKRGGDGDPVSVEVVADPLRIRVAVTRPDQGLKRISESFTLDTDALRESPDLPDLTLPCRADPGVRALSESVSALDSTHNHAYVMRDGATLTIGSQARGVTEPKDEDHPHADTVFLPNTAWGDEDGASSLFSLDYLDDLTTALKRAKADHVTLKWGDEVPIALAFEHDKWGFEGRYMLAPRVKADE